MIPFCLTCDSFKSFPCPNINSWSTIKWTITKCFFFLICPLIPIIEAVHQCFCTFRKLIFCCDLYSDWLSIRCKVHAPCLVEWPVVNLIFETHFERINCIIHLVGVELFQIENTLPFDKLFRFITESEQCESGCCISIISGVWKLCKFPVNITRDTELIVSVLHKAPLTVVSIDLWLEHLDLTLFNLILNDICFSSINHG